MRLIDADAMKNRIKNYMSVFAKKDWREICEMLNDAPTVDAEPVKHGHWIEEPIEDEWGKLPSIWHCSECDNLELNNSPYCPNCGAKMDEVEDEQ